MNNEQIMWNEFSKLHGNVDRSDLSITYLNDLWLEWSAAWRTCLRVQENMQVRNEIESGNAVKLSRTV